MSSSESQDEAVTYTKGKKIKRTTKSMRLMLSDDETKFRNRKFKNVDVINEYGSKLQCTRCLTSIKSAVIEGQDVLCHPLLKVIMCKKCIDFYGNGDFSLDEDDEDKYCRWCGEGGTLFVCSKCICGFCPKCIKKHFGKDKKKEIENDDDWICFFCKPDWLYDLRAICALAIETSSRNRKELLGDRKSRSTTMMNKGPSASKGKPAKRSTRGSSPNTSASEKGNTSEPAEVQILSSTDDEKQQEKEKSKTPKIALKRKRGSKATPKVTPKVNGKASSVDTSTEGTDSDRRGSKKPKTSLKESPKKPVAKAKESDEEPKKIKKVESDSSSDSEEEPASSISIPSKQVGKSLGKLTDLFKLTEMTAQLCLDVCRKHLKKLENKNVVVTNEKLIKESEKLKSVVTMLSTNLTTVSSTVVSLQNKLGVDENNEGDSQTNNENAKLNDAIKEFKRCKDMVAEALEEDLKWFEDNKKGEERREAENDADNDDSDKDSVKSEVVSDGKSKRKKKEKRNKKRKKESDDDKGSGGSEMEIEKVKKRTKSKKWSEDSLDDEWGKVKRKSKGSKKQKEKSEDDAEDRESEDVKGKRRKDCQDDENKNSDADDVKENDNDESVVATELDASEVGDRVSDANDNDDEKPEDSNEIRNEEKEVSVDEAEIKKRVLESSSSDEEEPLMGKNNSDCENRSAKSSDDNNTNNEEPSIKRKEKTKKYSKDSDNNSLDSDSEDAFEKKIKPKASKTSDEDETPFKRKRKESSDEDEKDDSDAQTESEMKCDKIVTKDAIKLREVKIILKPIEIPRDCDSISLNEPKVDVYDVETEDDEDEKEDIKKKTLKSSSDEDETLEKKKSKRRALLDSDDDELKANSSSENEKGNSSDEIKSVDLSSGSDDDFEKKKSKPTASKRSDDDESSDDGTMKKYRRIQSKKGDRSESSSDSEQERTRKRSKKKGDDKDSPTKGRKNIKRIIKKDKLHVETKQALKNEEARKERIKERQKEYEKLFPVEKDESGKQKRLVLDFDPETKEPTIEVHSKLVKKLKPHQIEGVKFMWDSCFESIKKVEEDSGSGCILAHCMGLGKTLQVITLVHTVMTHDLGVNTTLVVCPLNTVANWIHEFEMWLGNVHTDPITLYNIIKYKKDYERSFHLNDWHKNGGVMVISYDMFRNLTKEKKVKKSKKKDQMVFEKTLLEPGPDLVICDEGHLLKNEETALSKCMRQIATSRRIVLTGTPLQNNLIEYHCMVQFIKPNILGTKKEFSNQFVNPINNGQFEDSTEFDVKVMKRRSHVLHTMLDGCVQRFDYSVLTPFLPMKYEYVISIALSESQVKLYKYYLDHFSAKVEGSNKGAKLFSDYHHLQRIWTHPHTLLAHDEKEEITKMMRDDESEGSLKDFVVDDSEEEATSGTGTESVSGSGSSSDGSRKAERKRLLRSNANHEDMQKEIEEIQKIKDKKWWDEFITENDYEDLRASYKLVVLFSILKECKKLGDKVLVFSQSLYTLNLIEYFLEKIDAASKKNPDELLDGHADSWKLGRDYFRLDGSTPSEKRHMWTKYFNKEKNKEARLFLISTRAGGLGINLTAANRVIIFDASWNPSHDVQSIFRVYRFGQNKTCYIYRFLAEATMEEKIYERQVTKLSLAHRVVDEHQIERHYTMNSLVELYAYDPTPPEKRKTPMVPKDELFADILTKHKDIIAGYHEHDSLLENKQEEELTEEERKAAWEDFEKEKTARPNVDIAEQRIIYQRMQAQIQQQQQVNSTMPNLQNMQSMVNFQNPAFTGFLRDNLTRVINPMAMHANPMAIRQANPLMLNLSNILTMQNTPAIVQGTVISDVMIQRGALVGVHPFPGETPQSYFNRIRQEENAVSQRIRQQQYLLQTFQNRPT